MDRHYKLSKETGTTAKAMNYIVQQKIQKTKQWRNPVDLTNTASEGVTVPALLVWPVLLLLNGNQFGHRYS